MAWQGGGRGRGRKVGGEGKKQGGRMLPSFKFLANPHFHIIIFDNSGWLSAREQVRDDTVTLTPRDM